MAVGVALGGGFYLLLIDTTDLPELYVACGVALLVAVVVDAAHNAGSTEASFAPAWFARGWRVLARVPAHIALVSWEAIAQLLHRKAVRGTFRAVAFEAGGDGPRDAGRRAITEVLGSLTPNTIVIGVDPERDLLLVHQLHRQGGREELDVLRLG